MGDGECGVWWLMIHQITLYTKSYLHFEIETYSGALRSNERGNPTSWNILGMLRTIQSAFRFMGVSSLNISIHNFNKFCFSGIFENNNKKWDAWRHGQIRFWPVHPKICYHAIFLLLLFVQKWFLWARLTHPILTTVFIFLFFTVKFLSFQPQHTKCPWQHVSHFLFS